MLCDIDGLPGEMGGGRIAFRRGGVAVDPHQMLLEFDGADRGVYLQRRVKVGVVCPRHVGEELRGPGAGITAVYGQAIVYFQGAVRGQRDQHPLASHIEEVGVVLDAVEALAVGNFVLVQKDLVGAFEGWGDDETSALVVEHGKNGGGCGILCDAPQLGLFCCGADDADYGNGFGDGVGSAGVGTGDTCGTLGLVRGRGFGCLGFDGGSFQEVVRGGFSRRRIGDTERRGSGCSCLGSGSFGQVMLGWRGAGMSAGDPGPGGALVLGRGLSVGWLRSGSRRLVGTVVHRFCE
jgi:hypothetical protein